MKQNTLQLEEKFEYSYNMILIFDVIIGCKWEILNDDFFVVVKALIGVYMVK